MAEREKNLEKSWENRTLEAREKAQLAIRKLEAEGKEITFASVQKLSGVSKNFLYKDETLRKEIEKLRAQYTEAVLKQRFRYEKTSRSRDVVIETKDRRIAKLEEEIRKLKSEINVLRGLLYGAK